MNKLLLSILLLISYSISFSDELNLNNGYVIGNVQFIDTLDNMLRFKGLDIIISLFPSQIISREFEQYDPTKTAKFNLHYKERYKANDGTTSVLTIVTQHGETISGSVYRNEEANVVFFTEYGRISIPKDLIVEPIFEKKSLPFKNPLMITMANGDSFKGELLSSTDSTVTYQTSVGIVTALKKDVLSVRNMSKDPFIQMPGPNPERHPNRVSVKEYNALPLLIFTVACAAGAIIWFKDASDYSDAADALNTLGLKTAADEASSKSSEKLILGIGTSVASIVFFAIAITPTERYIDQPVTLIPAGNGIRLTVHF